MSHVLLDASLVVLVLLFAAFGAASGALRQLLRVVLLIAGIWLAPWLADLLEPWVAARVPVAPDAVVRTLAGALGTIGFYAAGSLIGGAVIFLIRRSSRTLTRLDRVGGGVLGGIKGAALAAVAAIALAAWSLTATPGDAVATEVDRSVLIPVIADGAIALTTTLHAALPDAVPATLMALRTLLDRAPIGQAPPDPTSEDAPTSSPETAPESGDDSPIGAPAHGSGDAVRTLPRAPEPDGDGGPD